MRIITTTSFRVLLFRQYNGSPGVTVERIICAKFRRPCEWKTQNCFPFDNQFRVYSWKTDRVIFFSPNINPYSYNYVLQIFFIAEAQVRFSEEASVLTRFTLHILTSDISRSDNELAHLPTY